MKIKFPRYYLYYTLLFVLLYFEDKIYILDVSLSNIWKIIAVLVFLIFIVLKKKNVGLSYFDIVIILFSLSLLINGHGLFTIHDIEELVLILIFPISYYSLYYIYRSNFSKLKFNLLIFSTFLILTSLPFLLNIFQLSDETNDVLVKFGEIFQLKSKILVGFFKAPSISSRVFVFSSIIVWIFGIQGKKYTNPAKIFFLIIFAIGIYDVYRSFTRTGWLMFIVFALVFVMMWKGRSTFKKILFIIILVGSLFSIYKTNDAIQNRIFGSSNNRNAQTDNIYKISSGRNILIALAIVSVVEEDNLSLFVGLGKKYALEKSYGALAHNRFVEIFQYGGLISLALYIIYLFLMYRQIHKRKTNNLMYPLSVSLYIIMILALLPSHGLAIWANLIFGGVVALNRIEFENENSTVQETGE